ncbi:MAG: hypothetical protein R3E79_23860 [Caldilineaceae bacterium]
MNSAHHLIKLLYPLYNMLYFFWPPLLVFILRYRRRIMARLITLWTLSGVISITLVLTDLSATSLLPQFGPEPQNTIILVTLRLAMLVLLASLLVRPRVAFAENRAR